MAFIYPFIRSRQEGSNALSLVDLSDSDLIQTTQFPRTAVTELCHLIADDFVRPTDHVTYASPLDAKINKKNLRNS